MLQDPWGSGEGGQVVSYSGRQRLLSTAEHSPAQLSTAIHSCVVHPKGSAMWCFDLNTSGVGTLSQRPAAVTHPGTAESRRGKDVRHT